ITDSGVKLLQPLIGLKALSLRGTQITDVAVRHLREIKALEFLTLQDTPITDVSVPDLEFMGALKRLDIRATKITKTGSERLHKSLPKTKVIDNWSWNGIDIPEP